MLADASLGDTDPARYKVTNIQRSRLRAPAEHLRAILQHVSEPPESLTAACSQHVQALLSRRQAVPLLSPHAQVPQLWQQTMQLCD